MASPAALGATVLSPTASIAVSVRHVAMSYSGVAAVDDVSFELSEGAFLTILGPSGSGKTTLLRMIAGFQTPTKGEIVIGGQPVRAVPPLPPLDRHGVPAARAVPAYERRRERRLPAENAPLRCAHDS